MSVLFLVGVLAALILAPILAAKVMKLQGGVGKGVMVALITLGANGLIGMVAQHLGPFGGVLGIMGFFAAWFQVVKVIHGTKTAETMVFMFWHLFFQLLLLSLLALFLDASVFTFAWPLLG